MPVQPWTLFFVEYVLFVPGGFAKAALASVDPRGLYRRGVKVRSRRLLVTTKTELNAIPAPATNGLSSPSAASGRAAAL